MKKTNDAAFFTLLMIVASALVFGTLTNGHDWGDDFAAYIMQAKSIATHSTHDFMDANRFTIDRSSATIGPIAYPWGVPLLLGLVYKIFGLNFIALKIVASLSYLFFLMLLWFGLGKDHKVFWRVSLVGLFALNPTMLAFTDQIVSDLPFLFFSTLSIVLIDITIVKQRVIFLRYWDLIGLGLAMALAAFMRSNGVLLIPTLALTQLVAIFIWPKPMATGFEAQHPSPFRKWLAEKNITFKMLLMHTLPYASFFCAFILWEAAFPKGGASHVALLKNISMPVIKAQLYYYATLPASYFIGIPFYRLVYIASIPFALMGALRNVRSNYHALFYIALTLSLYIVWPGTQGLRYIFPILPFYISFVLLGLASLQGDGTEFRTKLYYLPLILVMVCFGFVSVQNIVKNITAGRMLAVGPHTDNAKQMFAFITEHTAPESVIIFVKPRLMRLMTNRNAIMINKAEALPQGDYFCQFLQTNIYDDDQVSAATIEALEKSDRASRVYENSGFRIYKLTKP